MTPSVLVTDTHPLIWYLSAQHAKLSRKACTAFDGAVDGRSAIWVPAPVLWELSLLIKAGRVRTSVSLEEYVAQGFFAQAIHVLDLVPEDVLLAHSLGFTPDPWDTLIVATALRLQCPLITKDELIHRHAPCELYWD